MIDDLDDSDIEDMLDDERILDDCEYCGDSCCKHGLCESCDICEYCIDEGPTL
jgi:hypothetical protein